MPAKINTKKTTQRSRKGSSKRDNQPAAGRKAGCRKKADAPRIIANSIFALTLKEKAAIQVTNFLSEKGRASADDDYEKMYADILLVVQRAVFLATGQVSTFNPYKNGFDLSESFDFVLRVFKENVLPKGWDYNIEKDWRHGDYQLVIYESCYFDATWHVFPICHVVKKLMKKNQALHDMFVSFICNFYHHTGMFTWWNGGLGYIDDESMRDHLLNRDFDDEEEQFKAEAELEACIFSYNKGEAKAYESLLKSLSVVSVDQLREDLARFSKRNPLVRWMYSALDVMDQKYSLNDYVYPELHEEGNTEGLMFDMQLGIHWDINDCMCKEQEEYLDSEAQGCGIIDPIYHFRFKKDTEVFSKEEILKALDYPKQFTKLYNDYHTAISAYER